MTLIDLDALKRRYESVCNGNCEMCDYSKWGFDSHICKIIEDATTVDAQPVVHGKWIIGEHAVYCSECNHISAKILVGTNYCPNCGADMRGVKDANCKSFSTQNQNVPG